MHIEPGFVSSAKVLAANVAALFFSVFMQAFHLPVGLSELHLF